VAETAQAQDAAAATAALIASIQENVQAVDVLIARYLWEIIDDYELADWSVIPTKPTASSILSGAATFSGMPFGGQPFAGSEIGDDVQWITINTYESDDWAIIPTKE